MIIKRANHCTCHVVTVQEERAKHANARQCVLLVVVVTEQSRRHSEHPLIEPNQPLLKRGLGEVRLARLCARLLHPGLVRHLSEEIQHQIDDAQQPHEVLLRRVVRRDVLEGVLHNVHHLHGTDSDQVAETVRGVRLHISDRLGMRV